MVNDIFDRVNEKIADALKYENVILNPQSKERFVAFLKDLSLNILRCKIVPQDLYPSELSKIEHFLYKELEDVSKGMVPYLSWQDRELISALLSAIYKIIKPNEIKSVRSTSIYEETIRIEQNRLHSYFQAPFFQLLKNIKELTKKYRSGYFQSIVFISYAWPSESKPHEFWTYNFIKIFSEHLKAAGVTVMIDQDSSRFGRNTETYMRSGILDLSDYVLVMGTESFLEKGQRGVHAVSNEIILINDKRRAALDKKQVIFPWTQYDPVIPILLSGTLETAFPANYRTYMAIEEFAAHKTLDFNKKSYLKNLKELIMHLYKVAIEDTCFTSLWDHFEKSDPEIQDLMLGLTPDQVNEFLKDEKARLKKESDEHREITELTLTLHLNQKRGVSFPT